MPKFGEVKIENYKIEPLKRRNLQETLELYKQLHDGTGLSLEKRLLLRFAGSKFCYILISEKDDIFGLGLYYFNKRDIIEKTIHVGYTGMKKEFRGRGIGIVAFRNALQHFAKIDVLRGVSSRVSLDNIPSSKGNIKLGEIKEKYWDENEQKERVYLVCDLDKYRVNKK